MTKQYFLCSQTVVEHFQPKEVSKPFRSGYGFDKSQYYVAVLDFTEVGKYYREVIEPYNENTKGEEIDFWLYECTEGSMDVTKITLNGAKKKGLFVEMEEKTNLCKETNRAMMINGSTRYHGYETPIHFINRVA